MICYNCGLKVHSSNAKECHFCGIRFGTVCNACKAPNPPAAKFCCQCGAQFSTSQEVSSVQNFNTLSESRKNVAVLFADVSGFTALSEKLDPEVVREIINDCFTHITAPVYELGGTIDKYIGDCVMVLFGAKTSHIDDAKRAVLCAIKMTSLIKEFSDERIKNLGFDLQLSIGVHFGLVVTGMVGNYYDMDYTVMGDTVNTAQRIQSNTPRSQIYVSESIYHETNNDIEYSQPVAISVKNKENPILCYRPMHVINSLSSAREQVPMVGRKDCLLDLVGILENAEKSHTCIAGITGPAGIGKSTLVQELLPLVKEDLKIIRTECNPNMTNSPYSLISNLLMNIMNINLGESVIVKQSRIISYISFILAKHDEEVVKRNYQFISFLMGLEVDKEARDIISSMDTKAIYKEISCQLTLLLQEFENRFRTLIIIEDLHWADHKSVSLLKQVWSNLVTSKKGKNIYLYTSRNAFEASETIHEGSHKVIGLRELDFDSVVDYIKLYVGCDNVDHAFAEYIYSFSGGNPLYMYELLKYIKKASLYSISKDTIYLKQNIEKVPNSLQGLILSKLNYMSQGAIDIAQAASIIGKDFSIAVLNRLLQKDVEADNYLKEAVYSNIIYQKSTYTYSGRMEKLYSFAHETEREAIYNSILHKRKMSYHKDTAQAIEHLYSKNIESYFEILGDHFEKGGELLKSANYYSNAGQHNQKLYNTQEALGNYLKAYHCVTKLKQAQKETLYSLCVHIGELYSILSDFKNSKSFFNKALKHIGNTSEQWTVDLDIARIYKDQAKYKQALDILNKIQDQMKESHALYGSLLFLKCSIQRVIGQSQEALSNIKKAESILQKNKDYENLAKVLNAAGIIYHTSSDIDNALKSYNKAYKYAEKVGDLQTLMKCAANMATIYHIQGNLNQAMKYFNAAMELSKKISHKQGYVTNSNNLGILYMDKGLFGKAKSLFEEAAKISKETSTLFMQSASLSNLADIEYYTGDYKAAKKYAMQALDISLEIEDVEGQGINDVILAKISIEQGLLEEAMNYLDEAFKVYSEINSEEGWSDYYYYLAQYNMQLANLQEAMEYALKSKELAVRSQNSRKQAKSMRLIGVLHQRMQRYATSIEHFDSSIEILEKEEASYELAKSYYLRALSYSKLDTKDAVDEDMKAAAMNMQRIDKCKWSKIIEHGIQ